MSTRESLVPLRTCAVRPEERPNEDTLDETPDEVRLLASPDNGELIIDTVLCYPRDAADKYLKQQYMTMNRMLMQQVTASGQLKTLAYQYGC